MEGDSLTEKGEGLKEAGGAAALHTYKGFVTGDIQK